MICATPDGKHLEIFTYKQCAELDKLISPILFNAHGIQRNCHRSVMYLTDSLGGLKIMSIFHLQGFSKMQFYCIHTRNMDTTGKLLTISGRYTQLECGLSQPFFTYDFYKTYFLVTPTWTTNIWQYMTECHTTLQQYNEWVYTPPRQHDFFLMDILLRSNLPQSHIEIFNRVRLNLRLLTASDIVICNSGFKILPNIFQGINNRHSSYNWPTYHTLPKKWMEIFYNILRTTIKAQLNSTHLGHWISNSHQKWLTYLDTSGQIVHVDAQNEIPVHFTPIDIIDNTKILGTKPPPLPENQTNQNLTPMQLVQNAPNWL